MSETDRLEDWVRQLLNFSGSQNEDRSRVQTADVLQGSVEGFKGQLESRGIRVSYSPNDALPEVEGNSAALSQVINGLIANAIEAMPGGGQLDVGQRVTRDRRFVEITIADTGPGITPDQERKVFQPFVTSKGSGLGLGLALARRIVERHGGVIGLARGEPHGTIATVHLPVAS